MLIFLMWHKGRESMRAVEPSIVENRLQRLYAPLFESLPASHVLQNDAMALVCLEIPVQDWIPTSFEREGSSWALAVEYPVTARAVLQSRGIQVPDGRTLLTLATGLRQDPEPLLRALAPMYSLAWASDQHEAFLQNDGLGQAQIFEYDDGNLWAVSNKITAFRALGLPLEPESNEWAVRMTVDWFPMQMTGFRNIRFLAPATRLRLTPAKIERQSYDVLGYWLRRENLSSEECIELAYEGFQAHIRAVAPEWRQARCGLTGGRDSRAVASGLLREGIANVHFAVRGSKKSPDVQVAAKLAGQVPMDLQIRTQAMQPPTSIEKLRHGLTMALLWQAGYMDIRQHTSFLNDAPGLGGGEVNVMGQHGEIGRGYFAERIGAQHIPPDRFENALIHFAMFENTPGHFIVRREHLDFIRDTVRTAYRQAARYGLQGLDCLDFFYLYERTRRWASAGNDVQPGIIVTPFLNPKYLHAVFNYPAAGRSSEPFHDHIVRRNRPDWASVIYADELKEKLLHRENRRLRQKSMIGYYFMRASQFVQSLKRHYYPGLLRENPNNYWPRLGRPLYEASVREGGFWTTVFDADRVRKMWFLAPEQLVVTAQLPKMIL